jgi:hypothetical protein
MQYPQELNLTQFQVEVLYHRVQLLTDDGLIEELYDDRSKETRKRLVDSATKFVLLMRPEKAVTVTLQSVSDAEILAEALEGGTYFGNEKPTPAQKKAVEALADILKPLVHRNVIPATW